MKESNYDVLIVGAGISGLLAAHELIAAGKRVLVLDKSRGVGGRMATRRIDEARLDHGAQFFTVRSSRFAALVDAWRQAGVVEEWCRGFEQLQDGYPRYRGSHGMTSVPKHLAKGLDIQLQTRVIEATHMDSGWRLTCEKGNHYTAPTLLLTAPVPQSLALLDSGNASLPDWAATRLRALSYYPCIVLMATLAEPSGIAFPGVVRPQDGPIAWLADNQVKGISAQVPALTVHATKAYSEAAFDLNPEEICQDLLAAAKTYTSAEIRHYQFHRWRYSEPKVLDPEPCLSIREMQLFFAGDIFASARIEGAVLSGLAVSAAMTDNTLS